MKLLLAALALFALSHAAPPANGAHPYQIPSCHGIAQVPGYEKCNP